MRVEDSNLAELIKEVHVSESGTYFFFENFIITEINEGVTFGWENGKELIKLAINHYGKDSGVGFISNRVNEYSILPTNWSIFTDKGYKLDYYAIVNYKKSSLFNTFFEKRFFKNNIKRFENLYDAIDWMNSNIRIDKSKAPA